MSIIKKIFKSIGLACLLVTALTVPEACTDDFLGDTEILRNSDGTYGPFDIEVAFDTEAYQTQTRATFDTKDFKLECAWVGMFNVHDGKLVAMATSDSENFAGTGGTPGTGHDETGVGTDYKVILRSLMLNDDNSEVYLAGVANYAGISARDADGNDMSLIEALMAVKNIKDYKNISINTASAESAMDGENKPLMAGFWGTSHGNFTVSQSGEVFTNANTTPTFKIKMLNDKDKKVIGKATIETSGNYIHLRRLYSKLNVDITVDTKGFKEFKNPRLKVYNVPAYTFITEHKTIENADEYSNESWPSNTHTAADAFADGYFDTGEISESSPNWWDTQDAAFVMEGNDKFTVSRDNNGKVTGIKFGYWHYETKHWGLERVKTQNDRERMFGESGIYSSLCPSEGSDFNNKATLMVLTADVESADGQYKGVADFYIHEGYCCQPDGNAAATEAQAARDFSTFRNVEYTYKVNIAGMESIDTKVTSRDFSDDFYHGVGGELYSTTNTRCMSVPEGGASYDIELPKGQLFWYIETADGQKFGVPLSEDEEIKKWYKEVYKYTESEYIDQDNEFYKTISFNGAPLGNAPVTAAVSSKNIISFTGDTDVNGILYLCGVQRSLDGLVTYYTVYQFDQSGALATPDLYVFKEGNLSKSGNFIMGIDDHSVYWKPVSGASTYTIELEAQGTNGGYSVTLNPNSNPVSDGKGKFPTNVKIEKKQINGEDYLKFRIRYAISAQGMLSFLQSQDKADNVAIKVTAHKSDGESSEAGKIQINIINPVWDFRSDPWKSALLAKVSGDLLPTGFNLSFNGLRFDVGGSTTSKYKTFSNVYGLQPGASGSQNSNVFTFHSCSEKGKLSFWTTSNGEAKDAVNDTRYVIVDCKGEDGSSSVKSPHAAGKAASTASSATFEEGNIITTGSFYPVNYDVTGVENVRFYNYKDFVYYKIKYTPEDP